MSIDVVPWPAGEDGRLDDWLAAPHVIRWWRPQQPPPGARPWRIELDGRPIGYAEDHDPGLDGGIWDVEADVGPATRVVALLIGEPDAVNRKLGREAIRALASRLFAEPGIDRLVAAPHPDNWAAIIAFKRAGFRERGRRQFPAGPVMVLTAAKAVWKG